MATKVNKNILNISASHDVDASTSPSSLHFTGEPAMDIYYTIYEVTNNINGKKYRGVHKTHNQHDSYKGSGVHIKNAMLKYNRENFTKEILACALDEQSMYWLEKHVFVTDEWVNSEKTYNLILGGAGITEKSHATGVIKRKNTLILKYGVDSPMKVSEIKSKVKQTTTERYGVDHYFKSSSGKQVAIKNNTGERNPFFGKRRTKEEIENIIQVQKSRWESMSDDERWDYNERARKNKAKFVYILTSPTGEVYHTDSLPMLCDRMSLDLEAFKRALRKGIQIVPEPDTRRIPTDNRINTTGWHMNRINKSDATAEIINSLISFNKS